LDIKVFRRSISNVYTTTVGSVVYDTEIQSAGGIAISKYISNKVTFANNHFAEDAVCYLTAYRPQGTQINVYCKLKNSQDTDSFDSKAWTPMVISQNGSKFSSSVDSNDLIEYTYTIPAFSQSNTTVSSGSGPVNFTTQNGNNIIVGDGSASVNATVSVGQVVKIYNSAQPNAVYQVSAVTAANTSTFTIGDTISNSSMVGTGFYVDVLTYPNMAYHNVLNHNVTRYYNNSLAAFDTFDQMQLKIVLLADDSKLCPEVDQYQFIGVSA
jgi:activator of HSP90 ATPase